MSRAWFTIAFVSMVIASVSMCSMASPLIIPIPSSLTERPGQFAILKTTTITVDADAEDVRETGQYLADLLAKSLGAAPAVVNGDGNVVATGSIILTKTNADASLGDEGYTLDADPEVIEIRASTATGLFYGVQTLRQLLPLEIESGNKTFDTLNVPCVSIKDSPRFHWRGLMLDVSRHFFDKKEIEIFLDLMALHKLNVFHWHLVDDNGWRIEIKKYPKLTEIGAWRDHIDFGLDSKISTQYDSKGRYGGFYAQDDIRQVVAYAAKLHITIVPEIEIPGHSGAALRSYPEFASAPGSNVYNPGDPKTFAFLEDVLTEVMDLFPSKYIHIGGDEVDTGPWMHNPQCQALMKAEGLKNGGELQSYFTRRIDAFLTSKGRHLIGWDEILGGGLAPGAAVMSWRGIGGGIAAARQGHDAVMSPTSNCYFDYYQSRAPGQPRAIGGFLPLHKVYSLDPAAGGLSAEQAAHVLGAQGNIWTEYVPNFKHVEYMAYPRACAMAEITWSKQSRIDWEDFLARLSVDKKRFAVLGVNYCEDPNVNVVTEYSWNSTQMSEQFKELQWDVTKGVTKPGKYRVTMQYTDGGCRLDVAWVAVSADGKEISRDTHDGRTGASDVSNVYMVEIPQLKSGAKYLLHALVRSDGGTDSNGEITIVPAN